MSDNITRDQSVQMHMSEVAPPGYSQIPTTKPVLPSHNPRYAYRTPPKMGQDMTVIAAKTRITTFSEHRGPLPEGWAEMQHPEGDLYFFHEAHQIVTPVDPRDPYKAELLLQAFYLIVPRLHGAADAIHDLGHVEFFFTIAQNNANQVNYYLVDHVNKIVFWTHEVQCHEIGLPNIENRGHLKSLITPEYWVHLDYHPCHGTYPEEAAEELIGILSHGSIDDMTSPGSTCPYSAEECRRYLQTLAGVSHVKANLYRTACVARVWSAIARARHINSFGSEYARLDRSQGLEGSPRSGKSVAMSGLESFLFFIPITIHKRLAGLFNGRVVYQRHWHEFFNDLRWTWLISCSLGVVIVIANTTMLTQGLGGHAAVASSSLAGAAIFSALFLYQKHPNYLLKTGPDISSYVMQHEDYYQGLRPLAILLALPQGLLIYAGMLFYAALISLTLEKTQRWEEAITTIGAMSVGALPILGTTTVLSGISGWRSALSRLVKGK